MSRFRPPQKPGSKYITTEGARRLREELDELWRVERPRVTQAVSEAAAQGDRSENAEYIYGKRRLREIEFIRPDDAITRLLPVLGLERYPGTEEHPPRI